MLSSEQASRSTDYCKENVKKNKEIKHFSESKHFHKASTFRKQALSKVAFHLKAFLGTHTEVMVRRSRCWSGVAGAGPAQPVQARRSRVGWGKQVPSTGRSPVSGIT